MTPATFTFLSKDNYTSFYGGSIVEITLLIVMHYFEFKPIGFRHIRNRANAWVLEANIMRLPLLLLKTASHQSDVSKTGNTQATRPNLQKSAESPIMNGDA